MSVQELLTPSRQTISQEEWRLRVDLAGCYRIFDHLGWSEVIMNHITVRVPGPGHHFLINPYGLTYDEVTASNLVKIDTRREHRRPLGVARESGGLHDPQRDPFVARGCHLHHAYAHDGGTGGRRQAGRLEP